MRFHVCALPHTSTHKEDHPACAYTQKVRLFCTMMLSLGHEVYHYGGEGSEVDCTEHVDIITKSERDDIWGDKDYSKDLYDLKWDPKEAYWIMSNRRMIRAIQARVKDEKDFLCLISGWPQESIIKAFPRLTSVEFAVGYKGIVAKYCAFESSAWMHHVYGRYQWDQGRHYDAIIPNYYDPADFPAIENPTNDYFAFVGRMNPDKGPAIAADVCAEIGSQLKIAGQGIWKRENHIYYGNAGLQIKGAGQHVHHVGVVGPKEKVALMGNARALFALTQYIGPFEGVAAESMLLGTPVIVSDFGAFTETVEDGVDGFRCRTVGEIIWAAQNVHTMDRSKIRERALARFSIDVVRYQFENWFKQLLGLWGEGWNSKSFDPANRRRYP